VTVRGRELLAEELRELTRVAVGGRLDDAAAATAAKRLAAVRGSLTAPLAPTPWWWDEGPDPVGGWERFNPVAPPLRLDFDGQAVRGTVALGLEFTGPAHTAQGGTVATILDHALGIYLTRIERPSLTAWLTVKYFARTPLEATLEVMATHALIDGSTTEAWAEIRHEGKTTARAEGRFRLVPGPAGEGSKT
jgi:hypothetical protein